MEKRSRIVLLAIAVRLAIAPFFMHAGDVGTIYESSAMALQGANVYNYVYGQTLQMQHLTGLPVFFEGYAYHPLLIYFFAPFYWLFTLIAGPYPVMIGVGQYPSLPVLVYPAILVLLLMLKMPIILADVAVVYILAGIDARKAEIYALCPYVIFISVVWGMFDAIVAVFLLASYLTFSRNSFLSGVLYGLSLMKLYTIVLLPLFVVRLFGKRRDLLQFSAGLALTLLPVAYFMIVSPASIWNVLVTFQGTRLMGGVNLYNFTWIVQDLPFDLRISTIPNYFLIISLVLLLWKFGRKGPLLEAILAFMFASFLFGRVLNEQFLVSIFPLILLCKECDYRLWVAPFVFIFLRSPIYYFAIPILWASPIFYNYYLQADVMWMQLQSLGYLMIPMYTIGVAFSLLIMWNLIRILEATPTNAVGRLRKSLGFVWKMMPKSITTHVQSWLDRARFSFASGSRQRSRTWQRLTQPAWRRRPRLSHTDLQATSSLLCQDSAALALLSPHTKELFGTGPRSRLPAQRTRQLRRVNQRTVHQFSVVSPLRATN